MTPQRLLNTTRNGFERELLRSAAFDRAPDATRERALLYVAQALAGAPAAAGAEHEPPRIAAARQGARGANRARACLYGTLLALAAAAALLIHDEPPADTAPAAALAAGEPLSPGAPGQVTRAGAARSSELPHSFANTNPSSASAAGGSTLQSLAEDDAPDWLGAQLQLLGEARRQLDRGALEQAHSLLDSYALRFPDGVLGPQISALSVELQRRQDALSPRRNGTQLNLPRP